VIYIEWLLRDTTRLALLLPTSIMSSFHRKRAVATSLRCIVSLEDEQVQDAVLAHSHPKVAYLVLLEHPDLDHIPLLEAAPSDEVDVPLIVPSVPSWSQLQGPPTALHRAWVAHHALATSSSRSGSPSCTLSLLLRRLFYTPAVTVVTTVLKNVSLYIVEVWMKSCTCLVCIISVMWFKF
jgi:hypothetical protein